MRNLIRTEEAKVLCQAIVDLVSRRQRPFTFKVTVTGKPPHGVTRIYEIKSFSDNQAAMEGIKRFEKEMSTPSCIQTLQ